MEAILETDEVIKRRKKSFKSTISETDEEIKKRKKGMGSRNHSRVQFQIIAQMILKYNLAYHIIPELSLDINGKEKIPDLSFYKQFDSVTHGDEIRVKNLPLGVVEILSPTQALSELVRKADDYLSAGIRSYWLVAPEVQTVYLYEMDKKLKVFTGNDKLIDVQLNIELELSTIF
ncbi:MAG: Uma2 family endonuclease [Saprospiraceae bacterium]